MAMKTLFAAVFSLAMAGCAMLGLPPPGAAMAPCNTHVCLAKVSVVDCRISVDPPKIDIAKGNHDIEIHWDIVSGGYAFPRDGIGIKDDATPPEFSNPTLLTPTKFKVNDKNSFARQYHYGVKVMKDGTACPPLDPTIDNQG